jgi:hypothetical protein
MDETKNERFSPYDMEIEDISMREVYGLKNTQEN